MVTSKLTNTGLRVTVRKAYFARKIGTCQGLNSLVSIRVVIRWPLPASRIPLPASSVDHRQVELVIASGVYRSFVSSVSVTRDAGAGIVGQDALEAGAHLRRTIGDDNLAGVQGVADSHATAVMK